MPKQSHRIAKEVKQEAIRRIKEEGVPVAQAAKDHGVHESTIYAWLGATTKGTPSWAELAKLQKQNRELLELVGELTLRLSAAQKELMRRPGALSKTQLADALGVARSSLYYVSRTEARDWGTKARIEAVLREHPSYGSRRIALALERNRKGIQRVMRRFGMKPYRRRGRIWRKKAKIAVVYPNLLTTVIPAYPHHVWAADFTELAFRGGRVYAATVIDLYTRQIVGLAVAVRKGAVLTLQALGAALLHHPRPAIFHSDNGREYEARAFTAVLTNLGVHISRAQPGCPWENGYQESFYDKFKVELGDVSRFGTLGELVAEIYRTVWAYNHTRIHSALKMPPLVFARQYALAA